MVDMKILELKGRLPEEFIESAVKRNIAELTPPQEMAVGEGLLHGRNLVVASPTASGKTLIAEMAMVKTVLWERKKAVYVAPMRALVTEKYSEFKEEYPYLKTAISIGELDSLDKWLEDYDIVLVSTEKLDSLIRHGLGWLDQVGCFVFDEVHMLDDVSRGPTLEILITKLRRLSPRAQMIALSATIGNAAEIGEWLGAGLVASDYRPVPLRRGILLEGRAVYADGEEELCGRSKNTEARITEDTLEKGKQLLLFYASRRNAEAGADKLAKIVEKSLGAAEKEDLGRLCAEILGVLDRPTAQCERLAREVAGGVAFHHSGLTNKQRNIVEEAFRSGRIRAICATTTLAYGVNLPAHTVVVRDTSRYGGLDGMQKLGINEVLQIFGRAGRPRYDTEGRALLVARSEAEAVLLRRRYIESGPEMITSKLGVLPVLRTHVLAFVASGFLTRSESMLGFVAETFYGRQYSDTAGIMEILDEILAELVEWKFIERREGAYRPTRIGEKVSELYIDPVSAKWMVDSIPKVRDELSGLFMITNTLEMRPYSKATDEAAVDLQRYSEMLGVPSDIESYHEPERAFSTALMLRDWIDERSEAELLRRYGETPGSLYAKISSADWLLYSSTELAKLVHSNYTKLLEIRVRVKYGIRKELLDLVRLEQVGRVRARMMYAGGITKVSDLRKEGAERRLERLFGKEIARRIYSQVGEFAD